MIVIGFFLYRAYILLPDVSECEVHDDSLSPVWPEPASPASCDWTIFQNRDGTIPMDQGSLAKRFRLAGTFFAYGGGVSESRKAILHDLAQGVQRISSEKDEIGSVRVVRIFHDRVMLRDGVNEEQLWLSFSRPKDKAPRVPFGTGAQGDIHGPTGRFGGKRVGEHSWVFKREVLLNYYEELRNEPERLVNVFDSLKPIYSDLDKITGYRLGIEGEEEFFDAAGMKQGDIIRRVNSVPMTNRRRAEYFIGEFIRDRANAFVLDIERKESKQKLVYQIR